MPRRRSKKNHPQKLQLRLDPATRREILAIFFFTLAIVSVLSYFDLAAFAGHYIDLGLEKFFGVLRPVFFIALIAIGILVLSAPVRGLAILAVLLLLFSLLALVHLMEYPGQAGIEAAQKGLGGGYAGLYLALPFYQVFGFWASLVILLAVFFTALALLIPRPLGLLLASRFIIFRLLGEIISLGARLRLRLSRKRQEGAENEDVLTIHSVASPALSEEINSSMASTDKQEEKEYQIVAEKTKSSIESKKDKASGTKYLPKIDLPLDLLDKNGSKPTAGDIRGRSAIIQKTLQNFGIEVEMGEISIGPTVTQYTFRPADGVKLSSITALQNDLSLALAAHPIRIEAPIPGKSLVGVEVPNEKVAIVRLREVLESVEFIKRNSNLMTALGKDVAGKPWLADISRMPHLLVAGSTGSGKTVCLNSIIISLLFQNGPADLKLLLIDPKRVELPAYNGIPHLLSPVITEVKKTVFALRWTIGEMERRFEKLEEVGARDIKSHNEKVAPQDRMPYLVVIVDELADLMSAAASEVEASIIRLAQMARAVGIHLILATQRPSVDVLTGLIKANITSRIAFAVASLVDSRTILDSSGAEKLLGRGDMLFITPELGKPKRLQGAYISEQELARVVSYLKKNSEPDYIEIEEGSSKALDFGEEGFSEDDDPLLSDAREVIIQAGKASASLLQRRLKVGYARAARLLDILEAQGFIGPADGAKPREILQVAQNQELNLSEKNSDDIIP